MTLEILVAMKVVPKPEEVKVNLETMTLERAKARSEINQSIGGHHHTRLSTKKARHS